MADSDPLIIGQTNTGNAPTRLTRSGAAGNVAFGVENQNGGAIQGIADNAIAVGGVANKSIGVLGSSTTSVGVYGA